jgi:hypothetical protein
MANWDKKYFVTELVKYYMVNAPMEPLLHREGRYPSSSPG